MLNTKDVKMLRGMFGELLEANNHVLKREIRDEVHSLIKASEAGLIRRVDELEGKLTTRMDEGFSTVLDALDREVFPQLNRHEQEILALKMHVKIA